MDAYALVLNAGSSSLKFCVFQQPQGAAWQVEARGQIEGIGTSPRMSVKDARGEKLLDEKLDPSVRDGRAAIDIARGLAPVEVLRAVASSASGHRVVHGGPRFSGPTVVTPRDPGRAERTDAARPAPSTAQPRADRGDLRPHARRAAGGLLRHRLSSRARAGRHRGPVAPRTLQGRRRAVRVPRHLLRVHRLGPARGRARDRRRAGHRRAPGKRRQPLCAARTARASTRR